ncbi:hypothetical protein ACFL43_02620 [Thermodesulfobacteriota bacterium]
MPNIAQILKDEIQRLARKEINQAIASLKKSSVSLKKTVAEHKQKIAALERKNIKLISQQGKAVESPTGEQDDFRITGKQIKSLRGRLGISQIQLSKIVGASINIITIWENKPGRLQIRKAEVRKALSDLKGMTKAEVPERIDKEKKGRKGKKK